MSDHSSVPGPPCTSATASASQASSSRWVSKTRVVTTPSSASGLASSGRTASDSA